uniref:Uncharacterized protein n=1 Tax=Malurus cyaneus samueli TaxID=2593467 RepID=A0A8C5TT55_9PASS
KRSRAGTAILGNTYSVRAHPGTHGPWALPAPIPCQGSCSSIDCVCDDGRCVSSSWRCDGAADCLDGSDEQDCGTYSRCDGVPQCPDGSDETGCWTPTQECALRCDTATRCIPKSWLCDGHADCLDHSDEQGCGETWMDGWDGLLGLRAGSLFHPLPCRAAHGKKGCVGTRSGAALVAVSASLMSGAAMERLTAQMAVTRLAVSNTLILSPLCPTQGWLVGAQHSGTWACVCTEVKGPIC